MDRGKSISKNNMRIFFCRGFCLITITDWIFCPNRGIELFDMSSHHLKNITGKIDVEDVHGVMHDIREGTEDADAISDAVSAPLQLNILDDEELEKEMMAMEDMMAMEELDEIKVPPPKVPVKSEDAELAELAKEMAI